MDEYAITRNGTVITDRELGRVNSYLRESDASYVVMRLNATRGQGHVYGYVHVTT